MRVILLNGSPRENGNTRTALNEASAELGRQGVETDLLWIGDKPLQGCTGCRACRQLGKRCVHNGDLVNTILEKASGMDGIIIASPVYYSGPNGSLLALLNRVFYAGGELFRSKPGAAVTVARRAGTVAALDVLNRYFPINGMPVVPSCYWDVVFGLEPGDAARDEEGLQIMRTLAKNMAWLLKCIKAGKDAGIEYPAMEDVRYRTNFIR